MIKPLCVEIPKHIALAIKIPSQELENQLKADLAIRLYQKGILGFGKARELAGVTIWRIRSNICQFQNESEFDKNSDLRSRRRLTKYTDKHMEIFRIISVLIRFINIAVLIFQKCG